MIRRWKSENFTHSQRIHSGEKPHICNVCNKAFRQRGDRDKHVKARHPDAPPQIEPKKPKIKSFGRGRVRNNTSLYEPKPTAEEVAEVQGENQWNQKTENSKNHIISILYYNRMFFSINFYDF